MIPQVRKIEDITEVDPQWKDVVIAARSMQVASCALCGNANPKQRFMGCGTHLACNKCHMNESMVMRDGKCAARGCNQMPVWPTRHLQAWDEKQSGLATLLEKSEWAISMDVAKASNTSNRKRVRGGDDEDEEDDTTESSKAPKKSRKWSEETKEKAREKRRDKKMEVPDQLEGVLAEFEMETGRRLPTARVKELGLQQQMLRKEREKEERESTTGSGSEDREESEDPDVVEE